MVIRSKNCSLRICLLKLLHPASHNFSQIAIPLDFISVSVKAYQTLNNCRGVISELEQLFSTKEEILQHLKDQIAIDIRRITISWNGHVLPTKHIFLSFSSPILTPTIKTAYLLGST